MSPNPFTPTGQAVRLHAQPSAHHAQLLADTVAVLRQATRDHAKVVQASSLGAEDVVLTDLIVRHDLPIGVFVIDTGMLHPETLALLERQRAQLGERLQVYRPHDEAVLHFVRHTGQARIYDSREARHACCGVRKLEPLARALAGHSAWLTGLRAEQSSHRAGLAVRQADASQGHALEKFNPLLHWRWGDVWHHIAQHGVDHNPLHDQFFPSIGCAPCTRAISLGEDFRAGRWWWEQDDTKECGLHLSPPAPTPESHEATTP